MTTDRIKDSYKYCIGQIDWYDPDRGYGFLVTNNLGFTEQETKDTFIAVFFHETSLVNGYCPETGDLVIFQKKLTYKGIQATYVRRWSASDLPTVLRYQGTNAKISGVTKHNATVNTEVLPKFVKEAQKDTHFCIRLTRAFREYFQTVSSQEIDIVLHHLLEDQQTAGTLFSIFSEHDPELDRLLRSAVLNLKIRNKLPDNLEDIFKDLQNFDQSLVSGLESEIIFFLKFLSSAQDSDIELLQEISLWEEVISWLKTQPLSYSQLFLQKYLDLVDAESDEILALIGDDFLIKSLTDLSPDSQYQLVSKLPNSTCLAFTKAFPESETTKNIIKDEWIKVKALLPYTVFDLESDGNNIKEFAFKDSEVVRQYTGEEQISTLKRTLEKAEIVVGHNIKNWDLEILKSKGISPEAFIWDTLEIELLLNPCRYAYSLLTTHRAKDDVEKTDQLFWSQLYRLSNNASLLADIEDFLPQKIRTILSIIGQSPYVEMFKEEAGGKLQFFHEVVPLSENQRLVLQAINKNCRGGKSLLIAPKDLWPVLAHYLPLSFPEGLGKDFLAIDPKKIKEQKSQANIFLRVFFKRFCSNSKTPIFLNIPRYIKSNDQISITDFLRPYLKQSDGPILCIDIGSFDIEKLKNTHFDSVFVINSFIHERMQKEQIGEPFNLLQLFELDFRLYSALSNSDIVKESLHKRLTKA